MESRARFIRSFVWLALAMSVFFVGEFLVEWWHAGSPGMDKVSWAAKNNAKLVDVLSPMARAYNNVLAMLIATIGLAIPLTANMHTPKLIDMFLRDRTNQIMLGLIAFGAAHVLWAAWLVGPDFAPIWTVRLAVFGAMVGWAALIPYFFSVVRFLDPSTILTRLTDDTLRAVNGVLNDTLAVEKAQAIVHERMHQTGTIILKSIDRADRSVALEGIWGCKVLLESYGALKPRLPPAWFHVDRRDFIGASQEALSIINDEQNWFELRVMTQMYLAYQNALAKSTDAIPAISDATRVVASQAAARGDTQAFIIAQRFFHNYLREAIKRKDVHALYDLFYQYRQLGAELCDKPDLLRELGKRFHGYAEQASGAGITFATQIAGFDLGWLTLEAAKHQSPAAGELLTEVLSFSHGNPQQPLTLLVKAKFILGAGLLECGHRPEAQRVADDLRELPAALIGVICQELVNQNQRAFWEVTDRQVNFEWLSPEHRAFLPLFAALATAQA